MQTEAQNANTAHIDQMPTEAMLLAMNTEDATVAAVVRQAVPVIAELVDVVAHKLREGGRLFYVGAGTSGRLGVLDAAECVPTFGTPPEMVQGIIAGGAEAMLRAVEGAEDNQQQAEADLRDLGVSASDVVVGIAASGRTPYTIAAVAYSKEVGAATAGIACNANAPLLDVAEYAISLPVGAEVITGSTRLKAGTAQKLVLNMISTGAMVKLGKVYGNLMVDVQVTNQKLLGRAQRIVAQVAEISEAKAATLLVAAQNDVRTAIVMGALDISEVEAQARLKNANGSLRALIG